MIDRRETGPTGESESEPVVQIDSTVFEAISWPTSAESPRIVRWLDTWATGDR